MKNTAKQGVEMEAFLIPLISIAEDLLSRIIVGVMMG